MKKFTLIFFFIPITLIGQRYVSGYITDAGNGNCPVTGASVFISNTTIGAFTDANGHYQLSIPEEGSYQLMIIYVGYKPVLKDIEPGNTSLIFNVALHINENELKEVTVTEKIRFRQKDINLFWKTILGENSSQRTIRVVNPEAVYYYYNPQTRILRVTCHEPLQIINYETGYQIYYVLLYFTYDYNKDITDWGSQFSFTELKPENLKQKDNWEKKRREVYGLSLAKFIKSLYNNSLYNDGFVLATLSQNPGSSNPYQITLLNPDSIMMPVKAADNGKALNLPDEQVMLICYGRPVTSSDLEKIQKMQGKEFIETSGLFMNLLRGDSIRIFPNGTYANKLVMTSINFSITLMGLNMNLPIEYQPGDQTLSTLKNENGLDFESIAQHFDTQIRLFPQEKIYLHTDKPYYITGEKIFFRAFLLDALSNQPAAISRYVYVELINPADSVVQRLKIRQDSTRLFYGAIPLSIELPQGIYKIRAYTQYMRNQDESTFFSKQVRISDPQILSIQTQSDFQFAEDGKVNTGLRFVNAKTQEAVQSLPVTLRLNHNPSFTQKTDKDGWIRVKLTLPSNATARTLYVESVDNKNVFKQYLRIPYPEGDFEVSFYPEGGHLIAGQPSIVAFKALNADGAAMDVAGEITDSNGAVVAGLKTFYDGMGQFLLNPLPGEHYRAVCRCGESRKTFDLPEAQANALALKAICSDNKLRITINKPASASLPELYLLIHSRGSVVYAKAWDASGDFLTFDGTVFLSGINHILLLTKDFRVVSERLVFLLNDDNGVAAFQTQKDVYKKREQVRAGIQLTDEQGQALKGNFSIAVTNDKEVIVDSTSGILSGILLRSELRGHIENPEYYFQKGNKDAEQAADLLMKTNGWTRYAIPEVLLGELTYPKIPFETSQEITGIVKTGFLSKPAKNFKLMLVSVDAGFYDAAETDKSGRYAFRKFEFPDSTEYFIQALNQKDQGKDMTELQIDNDTFPEIKTSWTETGIPEEKNAPILLDYVAKSDLQYTYENGSRIINLPELEVEAVYKKKTEYKSYNYSEPDYSVSAEDIEKFRGNDVANLLYTVPGWVVRKVLRTNDDRFNGPSSTKDTSPTLTSGLPLLLIDGVERGYANRETLNAINIKEIGQLDVIQQPGRLAFFGSRGMNGVISIITKRGKSHPIPPALNIQSVTPLGYQLPVEFYSPRYDTQESLDDPKPDLRTTLYWKPDVITDDEGNAKLDFYTADDPGTYSVVIEGVSDDGKLIHYRGNASITVK